MGEPGNSEASVWWQWTVPARALAVLTGVSTDGILRLGVFRGNAVEALEPIPLSAAARLGETAFLTEIGAHYYFQISGSPILAPTYFAHLSLEALARPPGIGAARASVESGTSFGVLTMNG